MYVGDAAFLSNHFDHLLFIAVLETAVYAWTYVDCDYEYPPNRRYATERNVTRMAAESKRGRDDGPA